MLVWSLSDCKSANFIKWNILSIKLYCQYQIMFKDLSKVLIFYWVVLSLVKISWLAIQGSWRLISSKILHQPACIKSLVSILLPYATCPMMKHIMTFLIPDYHTGKLPIKWFQLWFPTDHKKVSKTEWKTIYHNQKN